MPIFIILAAVMALALVTEAMDRLAYRDTEWEVPLAEKDAYDLVTYVFLTGGVRGCGEFEIESQSAWRGSINVDCKNGIETTRKRVRYLPVLQVDGRRIKEGPSLFLQDDVRMGEVYCVKKPDGEWHNAYLSLKGALSAAHSMSAAERMPVRIYSSNSLYYWETAQDEKGKWLSTPFPKDEVDSRNERRGCELETKRLKFS